MMSNEYSAGISDFLVYVPLPGQPEIAIRKPMK
jgi:hypothetical protein